MLPFCLPQRERNLQVRLRKLRARKHLGLCFYLHIIVTFITILSSLFYVKQNIVPARTLVKLGHSVLRDAAEIERSPRGYGFHLFRDMSQELLRHSLE